MITTHSLHQGLRENSYQIAINIDINEQIKDVIIELDVTQFLAYLNQ